MKQLMLSLLILFPVAATFAQIKTSEVEIESRDNTEITGNLNLIQGRVKMEAGNPQINFFENDTNDQNWLVQANSGKLGF